MCVDAGGRQETHSPQLNVCANAPYYMTCRWIPNGILLCAAWVPSVWCDASRVVPAIHGLGPCCALTRLAELLHSITGERSRLAWLCSCVSRPCSYPKHAAGEKIVWWVFAMEVAPMPAVFQRKFPSQNCTIVS
jgi:hypothetical protein